MEICQKSVEDLITEITDDQEQMDGLIVKIEQLIQELSSVEQLSNKLFKHIFLYLSHFHFSNYVLPFST